MIFFCGTTRIRTGDTRIFSPMLYQLSYGTIMYVCKSASASFASAKVGKNPHTPKFFHKKKQGMQIFVYFLSCFCEKSYLCIRFTGSSAVGSALRSGRRGRAFESPLPDKATNEAFRLSLVFFALLGWGRVMKRGYPFTHVEE